MDHVVYVSAPRDKPEPGIALCGRLEALGLRCWTPCRDRPPKPGRVLFHTPAIEQAQVLLVIDQEVRNDQLMDDEIRWAESKAVPIVGVSQKGAEGDLADVVASIKAAQAQSTPIRVFFYAPAEIRAAQRSRLDERLARMAESARQRVRFEVISWGETAEVPGPSDIVVLVAWNHVGSIRGQHPNVLWSAPVDPSLSGLPFDQRIERLAADRQEVAGIVETWLGSAYGISSRWETTQAPSNEDETFAYSLDKATWRSLAAIPQPKGPWIPEQGIPLQWMPARFSTMSRQLLCSLSPGVTWGGERIAPEPTPLDQVSKAHYAAFAPAHVAPADEFVIEIWACPEHEVKYLEMVKRATAAAGAVQIGRKDAVPTPVGVWLTVSLDIPGLQVAKVEDRMYWDGDIVNTSFSVVVPPEAVTGRRTGVATILTDGIPLATLAFRLEVGGGAQEPRATALEAEERRVREIFASYANADRAEVLRWARAAKALGVDVFVDVLSLREGADWEARLFEEVPKRDLFCLFWSGPARDSTWVNREWRCALAARGLQYIHPVALADPRDVPPPPELQARSFGDPLIALIADEDRRRPEP